MPLLLAHNKAEPHLVHGNLDGRAGGTLSRKDTILVGATTTVLAGRLSECVQQEVSVPSFLHIDGKSGEETESPSCVHVKTAFGRLHVNLGHPKCLAAGGGIRKAQRGQ